mmetsp:Transcript_7676/g.16633  ORF Transcript_7676/g.16633 Transcript_7676/m.16633 type:complete len:667 (+) Transcript_7676:142-2142(+)
MAHNNYQRLPRRTALLIGLAGTAALSLQTLLTSNLWDVVDNVGDGGGGDARMTELEDQYRRILMPTVEEIFGKEDEEILAIPGDDMLSGSDNGEAPEPSTTAAISHAQLIDANQPLPTYTLQDAIDSSKMFDRKFALLIYDPDDDAFYGLYSKRHNLVKGCQKVLNSIKNLSYLLRTNFPERFQGKKSAELVIPISSGDYPGVSSNCIDHFRQESPDPLIPSDWQKSIELGQDCSHNTAPILHFGSVFRHPHMFPNIIAMPMPVPHHLNCFSTWATAKTVCKELREKGIDEKAMLLFGDAIGLKWEDLIPQVVWRGTDFPFLAQINPLLKKPQFHERLINWPWSQTEEDKMTKKIGGQTAFNAANKKLKLYRVRKRAPKQADVNEQILSRFTKAAAVESLKGQYIHLLPRWKAVVLTAEAEVIAKPNTLPWANMKFSSYVQDGRKSSALGAEDYKDWEGIGFATGDYKSHKNLAQYKYHIDLGGGGGTTWDGTILKLAMPGMLFHHLTPTKDYIHDWMKPWVHYVPVSSDLLDLKEKFDWAESHRVQSKKIADEGTKLMRHLTSPEGFEQMYQQDIVGPLRRVTDAYQPVSVNQSQTSRRTWREVIQKIEGDGVFLSVIKCHGSSVHDCDEGGGDVLGENYMKNTSTNGPAKLRSLLVKKSRIKFR